MDKKKEMWKKILIFGIVVVTLLLITAYVFIKRSKEKDNELTDVDRISKVLSTTRKTDIFVKGKSIDFDNKVSSENIQEIALSEIDGSGDYKVIIVNDLDDEVKLEEDEINLLKELICKNNYMLIYLGEKYATVWDDASHGIANVDGNLCYIYYSWDGFPTRNIGAWKVSDQETLNKYPWSLGQSILYSIEDYFDKRKK